VATFLLDGLVFSLFITVTDPRWDGLVESFAFAIERHMKPYFGSSASKRSLVGSTNSWPPVERLVGRSGGITARGLFVDEEDRGAMAKNDYS